MKIKKNRIKPKRVEITRTSEVSDVNIYDIPLELLHIVEWHPDEAAQQPAEQVHMVIELDKDTK